MTAIRLFLCVLFSTSLPQLLTSRGIISETTTLICLQVCSKITALNTHFACQLLAEEEVTGSILRDGEGSDFPFSQSWGRLGSWTKEGTNLKVGLTHTAPGEKSAILILLVVLLLLLFRLAIELTHNHSWVNI